MSNSEFLTPVWQLKKLFICNIIAFCLLLLWTIPFIHQLAIQYDTVLFRLLNGSLNYSHTWAAFWGIASMRYFDLLVALILVLLLVCGDWLFSPNNVRKAFFALFVIIILQVLIRVLFSKIVNVFGWQHASPSLVLEDSFRLSQHFPLWERYFELKDRSNQSFPGDHASVLLIWGLFLTLFATKLWHYVVIWFITLIFMLPRLVAGAHWASDDYIGGLFLALLALAWGFYTPFAGYLSSFLVHITLPVFRFFRRIPLFNRFNIVRYPV